MYAAKYIVTQLPDLSVGKPICQRPFLGTKKGQIRASNRRSPILTLTYVTLITSGTECKSSGSCFKWPVAGNCLPHHSNLPDGFGPRRRAVAIVDLTGPAKTTLVNLMMRFYGPGGLRSTAWTWRRRSGTSSARGWAWCYRTPGCSAGPSGTTLPMAGRTLRRRRSWRRRASSGPCRRATTRCSTTRAATSRPMRSSCSPLPGSSGPARRC